MWTTTLPLITTATTKMPTTIKPTTLKPEATTKISITTRKLTTEMPTTIPKAIATIANPATTARTTPLRTDVSNPTIALDEKEGSAEGFQTFTYEETSKTETHSTGMKKKFLVLATSILSHCKMITIIQRKKSYITVEF